MTQSRRHSLEETIVSTLIGFIVSTALNAFVVPLIIGAPVNLAQNLLLTGMFTIASIARGYVVRRHYNGKLRATV